MSIAVQESISAKPPPEALLSDRPPQFSDQIFPQIDPSLTASDEPFLDVADHIVNKSALDKELARRSVVYHGDVQSVIHKTNLEPVFETHPLDGHIIYIG